MIPTLAVVLFGARVLVLTDIGHDDTDALTTTYVLHAYYIRTTSSPLPRPSVPLLFASALDYQVYFEVLFTSTRIYHTAVLKSRPLM